jgi:hypothetical protein
MGGAGAPTGGKSNPGAPKTSSNSATTGGGAIGGWPGRGPQGLREEGLGGLGDRERLRLVFLLLIS